MKKIITLILTALLAFTACLGACSQKEVNFTKAGDQLGALTDVKAGYSDIAVIDSVMANYYVNKETFSDLQILTGSEFQFANEYYAIGFRKNTNTKLYVDYALYALQENGKLAEIAEKYGLTNAICEIPETAQPADPAEGTDFYNILQSGVFNLGYTIFEPIAYMDGNELIGFDIELAEAVCEIYDLTLVNKKINWNTKDDELNTKNIDCIWNGFTYSEKRAEGVDFSCYYMTNSQSIVIRKADAGKYTSYKAMKQAKFIAESESAGQSTILDIINAKIFG